MSVVKKQFWLFGESDETIVKEVESQGWRRLSRWERGAEFIAQDMSNPAAEPNLGYLDCVHFMRVFVESNGAGDAS